VTGHAMKYDAIAELVLQEIDKDSPAARSLRNSQTMMFTAERKLVEAYGEFRDGLRLAAEAGNTRAQQYLTRTTWDLT